MKTLFKYLLILSGSLLLTTCSDEPEIPPTLTVSGAPQSTFGPSSTTLTLNVTTTVAWTAKSNAGFCHLDTKSGMGNATVTITIEENQTYNDRTAEITFSNAEHGLEAKVSVSQAQKNAILLSKNSYTVDYKACDLELKVSTNVDFQTSIDAEWITHTESRVLQEVPVVFHIAENPDVEPREGTITLTHEDIKQEIKVVQEGKPEPSYINILHTNLEFSAPLITGKYLSGTIHWGDNNSEEYDASATHVYTQETSHTISIETLGAENISFDNVIGIIRINLSEF